MKRILQNKNGITLIALVITIVVLIILAGVLINLTIGDSGLFTRAKTGAQDYKDAHQHEQAILDSAGDKIDKHTGKAKYKVYEEYEEISYTYTYKGTKRTENFYIIDGWGEDSPTVKMISKYNIDATNDLIVQENQDVTVANSKKYSLIEAPVTEEKINGLVNQWSIDGETGSKLINLQLNGLEASTPYKALYYAQKYGAQIGGQGSLPKFEDVFIDRYTYKNDTVFLPPLIKKDKRVNYWIGTVEYKIEQTEQTETLATKSCYQTNLSGGYVAISKALNESYTGTCGVRPVITINKDKLPDSSQLI